MRSPVSIADFFSDERIKCCIIGNAKQRLGKTHECNALAI